MTPVSGARPRTARRARTVELIVAVLSVGEVIAAVVLVDPDDVVAGGLLVVALGLAAAPFVAVALLSAPVPAPPEVEWVAPPADGAGGLTTLVRVGGEPMDLVVACATIAAVRGPTVLVTAGRPEVDAVAAALAVPLVRRDSIEAAVVAAAAWIPTEAVLVVQPGAVPIAHGCVRALARLTDGVDWVIGAVRSFDDGYAPEARETLGARLRRRARAAGLVVWERDATIVRTALLRRFPPTPRHPWGAVLRAAHRHGATGADEPAAVVLRTSPAGASGFWPRTVSHQRAGAADLSQALGRGAIAVRLLAAGLLLRELYVYPVAVLLTTPLIVGLAGSFPFRGPPVGLVVAVLALATARWAAMRLGNGAPLRPVRDLVGAVYDAPGSARALVAACSRRLAPSRVRVSQRTLLWATLVLAAAAVVPLLDRRAGDPDLEVAAGLAVWLIVMLWFVVLRLYAARTWTRAAPRATARVPVVIAGIPGRTVDVGPAGFAATLAGPVPDIGATVEVRLAPSFVGSARVADRRLAGTEEIIGLEIAPDVDTRVRWARAAFAAADLEAPGVVKRPERSDPAGSPRSGAVVRVLDRAALVLAGTVVVLALGALSLAVAGYRPLVVRSGSMAPTIHTGDLIVADEVRADEIRVGDIVTFTTDGDDGDGEEVTHRVRAVARTANGIRFETRGDANPTGERWSRAPDEVVARYELRVPGAGRYLAWLRDPQARWAYVALVGLIAAAGVVRAAVVTRLGVSRPR